MITTTVSRGQKVLLALIFLSGFFGLSYEILLTRSLTTLFGSIFYVSAGVMSAFFIGIGISAFFAQKHFKKVGLVEIIIGITAIIYGCLYLLATENSGFFFALVPDSEVMILLVPAALTMIPALLVGCSMPMLYELYQRTGSDNEHFPAVFSMYNIGALVCVLIVEVILVRYFGISSTLIGIGLMNLLAGIHLSRHCRNMNVSTVEAKEISGGEEKIPSDLMWALAVSSIAFGMFQIFGLKLMSHVWGATASNVAAVIGSALIGSALGGMLFSRFKIKLSTALMLSIPALTFSVLMIEPVAWLWSRIAIDINNVIGAYWTFFFQSVMVFVLLVPSYILIGPTESIAKDYSKNTKAAGVFIGITSLGNASGIIMMSLFVHGNLDDHVTFILICAIAAFSSMMVRESDHETA